MSWSSNLKRIRRFLRDPDGNIWTDAQLRRLFNDEQFVLQTKTRLLEDVQAVRVPPMFDFSYLHDWEWPFLSSTTGNYQALRVHQQSDIVFCHRWEPQAEWGLVDATAPDEGIHFTHPFEAFMGETPGDAIHLQLPHGFHDAKLVAWDREPIEYMAVKSIQQDDPSWLSRTGEPFAYWRPDKTDDHFCLYPAVSSPDWNDTESGSTTEAIYLVDENGNNIIHIAGGYIVISEGVTDYIQDLIDRGIGQVLYRDGDTLAVEVGTIADGDGYIPGSDMGIATDIIDADENVLFVFTKTPTPMAGQDDESDFPEYLQKYVEYATLERAYTADTDGQIQSLRDYWAMRKDLGLKAIQRFMGMRRADRDYRLVTRGAPGFRTRREPRLPDEYPAVRR